MRDLYVVLQVHPKAEPGVIRAAYRVLARSRHPDAGGSDRAMSELNEAMAVLGDPRRRAGYDRERESADPTRVPAADPPGPPPSARASTPVRGSDVLTFGRYAGWSIQQLVHHDPDYLEWLARTPAGRGYVHEIRTALDAATAPRQPTPPSRPRTSAFGVPMFGFARR